MTFEVRNKKLFIEGKKVRCPLNTDLLSDTVEKDGVLMILFHDMEKNNPIRNILAYNCDGKLLWRIADHCQRTFLGKLGLTRLGRDFMKELRITDDQVIAVSAIETGFVVDVRTGKLTWDGVSK